MKFDTILFDVDGTILNTCEGITKGVAYGIEKCGLPPLSFETRKRFIGPPLRESFMKYCGVSAQDAETVLKTYREYYSAKGMFECEPYDGIEELLQYMTDNGYTVYTATAKPVEYTSVMLEKFDLKKYFKEIIGASMDKSMDTKEKIIKAVLDREKTANAVMIGDTAYDVLGARENNVPTIAVTYGFGNREDLLNAKPDYIAETVEDIYKYI
ncbi:MAG: HAD hydrolase-like protein [Clostridia bacterium]|nr:HAD hydrolase-like protein [Clostridia bacterium]